MRRLVVPCLAVIAIPLLAQAQNPGRPAPTGWSFATEGPGIPPGQSATDYAIEIDHSVVRGGHSSLSIQAKVPKPSNSRSLTQIIKADSYRGKRVRLSGYLKTREVSESSSLWLRIDGPTAAQGYDVMDRRPVTGTTEWTKYELTLDVPESAMRLAFGALLTGSGQIWVDDLTLEPVDPKEVKSTQLLQYSEHFAERPANLGFEDAVSGWDVHGHGPRSYTHRVAEAGAHGGRAFLEVKSTDQGFPLVFSAVQNLSASPYKGKRVRFSAFIKTDGAEKESFLALEAWSKSSWLRTTTVGRGVKGTSGWQLQEMVIDVPADAEIVGLCVELFGSGTFGADDFVLEVVDPEKVALIPESDTLKAARAKRNRELVETYPSLPERPINLDFEG